MAKSLEERVAYLERYTERLEAALGRHFHLGLAADEEPLVPPLDAMTKVQLADYAGAKGIDIGGASTKADMIAAIQLELESREPATGK